MSMSPHVDTVIRARNFTNASRTSAQMRHIVIHTMETPEAGDTAESISRWAAGPTAPQASWHYGVDSNSIVGCVDEEDVAWAAPGANSDGIQIELAGRASQTAAQWADAYSKGELVQAAKLVADICKRRGITPIHLTNAQLAGDVKGVCGHVQVSQVFKQSTHTDPGPHFPWASFMADVKALMPDGRRWEYRLLNKEGTVVDRSVITGTAGLPARYATFTARVAKKFVQMQLNGRKPKIVLVKVAG